MKRFIKAIIGSFRMWFREIEAEVEEDRRLNDVVKSFLDECCVTGPGLYVTASDLKATYSQWFRAGGGPQLDARQLFQAMAANGFQQLRSRRLANGKQVRTWEGIRLRTEIAELVGAERLGCQ